MVAGIYWILRQGHQRHRSRLIYQGFLPKSLACTMECPCFVHSLFTSVALRAKAARQLTNQPTNQAIPFQNPVSRMLGVINPSYEMRLYTVRIRDDASKKLLLATWTILYLRERQ